MKPSIQLVVTDLDNTLYDWVSSFVPALYSMVNTASVLLGVSEEQLLDELRAVHRQYGNSEQPYALLETPTVGSCFPGLTIQERRLKLDPAFHAFNTARKHLLRLYDGVRETLVAIRRTGVIVVAHTDAHAVNSLYRLIKLDLTGLIAKLYAPQSKSLPSEVGKNRAFETLRPDYVCLLPLEDRKPNPKVLRDIAQDFGIALNRTLYIGDSLVKDVYMARAAGAYSAWARYGADYDRLLWSKLVRVTHWTEDDISRETELRTQAADVIPDCKLEKFSEVLEQFSFGATTAIEAMPRFK